MKNECDCHNKILGWSPLNATVEVNEDKSISIIPPEGYIYVGVNKKTGGVLEISEGHTSISCTCRGKGSCLPFTSSMGNGCYGNCTECLMIQSAKIHGKVVTFDSGGYVNLIEGVHFMDKNIQIPAAFEAMFHIDIIKKGVVEFVERIYQGMPIPKLIEGKNYVVAPEEYSFAIVNAYGRAIGVLVPNLALSSDIASGTAIKCHCTNGSCSPDSVGMGAVKICKGACSGTCTLSTIIVLPNGEYKTTYTAITYQY